MAQCSVKCTQALPEPSESEEDPDDEEVEVVLDELIDMVEEVAGVMEALIGNVVLDVEGELEEREGSVVQTEDGAEVLSLEPVDGANGVGGLIPKKDGGSDDDEGGSGEEEEEEEDSDDESATATPKPQRVGWATYCGAPKKKKKKKVPGDPNFADRHFTVLLERSEVGIERFYEGAAYAVTEAKASAMNPVLSAWAERLESVIERAGVAGVDETGPLMKDARMARAQRVAWVRIAAEAAAEEQALLTDVEKLD